MDFGGKNTVTSRRIVRDVKFRTSRPSSIPSSPTANCPQSPKSDNSVKAKTEKSPGVDEFEVQVTSSQEYVQTHETSSQGYVQTHKTSSQGYVQTHKTSSQGYVQTHKTSSQGYVQTHKTSSQGYVQTHKTGSQGYVQTHKTSSQGYVQYLEAEQLKEVSKWSGYLDKGGVVSTHGDAVCGNSNGGFDKDADADVFDGERVR